MALYDILILVLALSMILIGLQAFLDPARRKVASEVLKATFLMVTGLYLLYFWYTEVTISTGNKGVYSY
jgi:uncharacterized membrane protein HdeD (DUF308 family)